MSSAFTIRFTGKGISPDAVPLHELAALLVAAENAILGIVRRDFPEATDDQMVVSLDQIKHESLGLAFADPAGSVVTRGYSKFVETVDSGALYRLPGQSLDGLRAMTRFSGEYKCATQFYLADSTLPSVVLPSDYEVKVPRLDYIRGETSVYGTVERAGGVLPRVKIKLSESKYLYCSTTGEQARLLGARLYKEVGLDGRATWDPRDGTMVYFAVDNINLFEPTDPPSAFRELAAASGGAYDDMEDLDGYIASLRMDD